MIIDGISVQADPGIPEEVVLQEVAQEKLNWMENGKPLALVRLRIDDGGIVVEAFERSPIRRVRRITGYLSNIDNFNDSKRQEAAQRRPHELR